MVTLGLDSSTQSVKALVWDSLSREVLAAASVNFGRDLPSYGAPEGFIPCAEELVRRADPLMWLAGLDLVLERLGATFDLGRIEAVGGCGQQHGSIYLNALWPRALASLGDSSSGGNGLADAFSASLARKTAPIWMDSSTTQECRTLEAAFGDYLLESTGSRAIERFTLPQIMKFAREEPAAYAATGRIHLVSSFLASVLSGSDAPVDTGDGAGMNALDLRSLDWDEKICSFAARDLLAKLPRVHKPSEKSTLRLAKYFARYGLRPGIPVAPFTGDNPSSLVGTGADKPGLAVISLGTSDVFFAAMDSFRVDPAGCGHVFGNPSGGFMSLLCVKNGSLAREKVRAELGLDYKFFDETAFDLAPAASGKRAFPYFESEIAPIHPATGIEANFDWSAASAAEKVRAIIEGQIANLYDRTRWIGSFDTIRVTGGASKSKGIRETISRLFGAKVETLQVADSAALGAAIIAARSAEMK